MSPFRVASLVVFLLACREPLPIDAPPPLPRDASTSVDVTADVAMARDARRVRVATFNVHRYFDTVCDSGNCDPGDFEEVASPTEFARRTNELASAIERMDVDVALLQEIETEGCLRALRDRLGGAFPVAVMGEIGTPASVDVAVLARDRLIETRTHRRQPITRPDGTTTVFSREFLEVHLQRGARRVVVFSAHFRSMVNDDPGRRIAEAQTAHTIVTATAREFPDALVVFGGDLNDDPMSPTINALEEGGALVRVARELAPPANITWSGTGGGHVFDHIFHAVHATGGSYVQGSAVVLRDAASGGTSAAGYGGSDHGALRADFMLRANE